MRLQAGLAGASGDQFIQAFCFSTDLVGNAAYIMGDEVGTRYQVTKVDIGDISHMPSIGIIIEKDSPTTCVVQRSGLLTGVYTGLTPQRPLFIGTDGMLTQSVPTAPTSGRRAIQRVAQAVSSSTILIHVKSPLIRIS